MNDQNTGHRIVLLGAGYTGMMAAIRVARRTRRSKAIVTLVNPSPRFTERLRMHQLATAQSLPDLQIADMLDGTGVVFVQGCAAALDPDANTVEVATATGTTVLGYDRLVYAIGSVTDTASVAGVDSDAFTLNGPAAAAALAARLDSLAAGCSVVVCGNGLTGVEMVAEIAESHPHLRTTLVGRGEAGAMMGPKARAYLLAALDRLHVEVRTGVDVTKVLPDAVEIDDGELLASDATVWTTGFRASPLAAAAGITVDQAGRIVVDAALRSTSHPRIYAVGDAASIRQGWGVIHGTCQSGIPSAAFVADAIARDLRGKSPKEFRFGYIHQPVSLGRNDGVIQFTKADDTPRRMRLTGSRAARYKELVTSSPPTTYGLSRHMNIPRAMLAARGGRKNRIPR